MIRDYDKAFAKLVQMNIPASLQLNIIHAVESGSDLSDEAYRLLFRFFCDSGEMPYGVAKARTGDPYTWIQDKMNDLLFGENQ